jgi:hypothetical protein
MEYCMLQAFMFACPRIMQPVIHISNTTASRLTIIRENNIKMDLEA